MTTTQNPDRNQDQSGKMDRDKSDNTTRQAQGTNPDQQRQKNPQDKDRNQQGTDEEE